ncbi:MAG: tryptophan synthase subunit alpha [Candidatus Diapherotrites archaeon]
MKRKNKKLNSIKFKEGKKGLKRKNSVSENHMKIKNRSRYEKLFSEKKQVFIPFTVLGFPNEKQNYSILKKYLNYADALELGIPFSDPLADGKTIQKADETALRNGMNTKKAFALIKKIRKLNLEIPIGLLVYCNTVYAYGLNKFYSDAKKAGVDGILIADLSLEESKPYVSASKKNNIRQIFIISQNTPIKRIKKISGSCSGFIYAVSLLGVTGERKKLNKKIHAFIKRIRSNSILPVCVGFGVSNAKQVEEILSFGADGVIVGSALVKAVEKGTLGKKLNELKKAFNINNAKLRQIPGFHESFLYQLGT